MKSLIGALTFALSFAIVATAPARGEGEVSVNPSTLEAKASLRTTQLIFAAVLDQYEKEGLEKYRPEFLIHERYLRTFIYEWGRELETTRSLSTLEIWQTLAQRKSFLGQYFSVWMRTFPVYYEASRPQTPFNIGNLRETFLVSVLASESIQDPSQRAKKIVSLIAQFLLPESDDVELGLKILDAYTLFPDPAVRQMSVSLIEGHPKYFATLQSLILARNVAIGLNMGPGHALKLMGSASFNIAKHGVTQANLWARRAIRIPEIVPKLWTQTPMIAKALGISTAAHLTVALTVDPNAKKTESPTALNWKELLRTREIVVQELQKSNGSTMGFISALSMSTVSERSERLVQQADFALPAQTRSKMGELFQTRASWAAEVQRSLNAWNTTGSYRGSTEFWRLMLEGERLIGVWPKASMDSADYPRLVLESRFLRMRKRINDAKVKDIEDLRSEILENELEDYRGEIPNLTSVLLDWGGNCVAQSLLLLSVLVDRQDLVPAGSTLGLYISKSHMEVVLMDAEKIRFLFSGAIKQRAPEHTVVRPQAILVFALAGAGADVAKFDLRSYYLNGRPTSPQNKGSSVSQVIDSVSKFFNFNSSGGLFAGAYSVFESADEYKTPFAPSHAKVGYREPTEGSSSDTSAPSTNPAASFFANMSSRDRASSAVSATWHLVSPIQLRTPFFKASLCLAREWESERCNHNVPEVRKEQLINYRWLELGKGSGDSDRFYSQLLITPEGTRNLGLDTFVTSRETYERLRILPKELWYAQVADWTVERILKGFESGTIPDARSIDIEAMKSRIASLDLNESDRKFVHRLRYIYPVEDLARKLTRWLASMSPSVRIYIQYEKSQILPQAEKAMLYYLSDLKDAFPSLTSEIRKFETSDAMMQLHYVNEFYRVFREKLSEDPSGLVRAFPKLSRELKVDLMLMAQGNLPDAETLALNNLGTYLNSLSSKDFDLRELSKPKEGSCAPVKINLPKCSSPEGCKAFKVVANPSTCDGPLAEKTHILNGGQQNVNTESWSDSERLTLSPLDIAELTMIGSGGLQLWNEKVLAAAVAEAGHWMDRGVELHENSIWPRAKSDKLRKGALQEKALSTLSQRQSERIRQVRIKQGRDGFKFPCSYGSSSNVAPGINTCTYDEFGDVVAAEPVKKSK